MTRDVGGKGCEAPGYVGRATWVGHDAVDIRRIAALNGATSPKIRTMAPLTGLERMLARDPSLDDKIGGSEASCLVLPSQGCRMVVARRAKERGG